MASPADRAVASSAKAATERAEAPADHEAKRGRAANGASPEARHNNRIPAAPLRNRSKGKPPPDRPNVSNEPVGPKDKENAQAEVALAERAREERELEERARDARARDEVAPDVVARGAAKRAAQGDEPAEVREPAAANAREAPDELAELAASSTRRRGVRPAASRRPKPRRRANVHAVRDRSAASVSPRKARRACDLRANSAVRRPVRNSEPNTVERAVASHTANHAAGLADETPKSTSRPPDKRVPNVCKKCSPPPDSARDASARN